MEGKSQGGMGIGEGGDGVIAGESSRFWRISDQHTITCYKPGFGQGHSQGAVMSPSPGLGRPVLPPAAILPGGYTVSARSLHDEKEDANRTSVVSVLGMLL